MIDGITILNEITNDMTFSIIMAFFIGGVLVVLSLLSLILLAIDSVKNKQNNFSFFALSSVVLTLGAIALILAIVGCSTPIYTQYEVTISDKVSFVELNEKYRIIEQRGEIYIIQERNNAFTSK